MVRRIFIVTTTSVYHLYAGASDGCNMVAEKIYQREDAESEIPLGRKVKGPFHALISEAESGFVIQDGFGIPALKGSSVIAMFALKNRAIRCAKQPRLVPYDPRWACPTGRILSQINRQRRQGKAWFRLLPKERGLFVL